LPNGKASNTNARQRRKTQRIETAMPDVYVALLAVRTQQKAAKCGQKRAAMLTAIEADPCLLLAITADYLLSISTDVAVFLAAIYYNGLVNYSIWSINEGPKVNADFMEAKAYDSKYPSYGS
jgi:hypothetical protein